MREYTITGEEKIRLDKVISKLDETLSRMQVQRWIEEGKVTVNGKQTKASYLVQSGDKIQIEEEQPKDLGIKAEEIPLDILYEDNDIIVINKTKGMVVHPAEGNLEGTLVNALMAHCKGTLSGIGGVIRPGIVHRLDKDTSGVIIVAKNDTAHLHLTEQMKDRKMKKTYLALVRGNVPEEEATINMPIARSKKDRKKMAVDKDGKQAVTHFKILNRYLDYTYLEVKIETGRTHQIRVHLSHIGYPIVGDMVYSNGKNPFGVEGQMLHATSLEFTHPVTGKKMLIKAPLPTYFQKILQKLQKNQIRYIVPDDLYKLFTPLKTV